MKRIKNAFLFYQRKGSVGTIASVLYFYSFVYFLYNGIKAIWPVYVSLPSQPMVFYITQVVHPLMWMIAFHLVMVPVYNYKIPFFEKYRVQKNQLFPWEKNRDQWYGIELPKILGVVCLNVVVLSIILAGIDTALTFHKIRLDLDSFPSLFEVSWQLVFCAICEDTVFYWSHRIFHRTKLYKYHKLHHEHYNSFSLSAFYSHPIDYLLSSLLAFVAGWKILRSRMHYASYLVWSSLRILETLEGHCGYDFPWSPFRLIPFSGSSEYHNFHHSHNEGNFESLFTFWDSICNTNKLFYELRPAELGDIKQRKIAAN